MNIQIHVNVTEIDGVFTARLLNTRTDMGLAAAMGSTEAKAVESLKGHSVAVSDLLRSDLYDQNN
jgi:hypothetical protein